MAREVAALAEQIARPVAVVQVPQAERTAGGPQLAEEPARSRQASEAPAAEPDGQVLRRAQTGFPMRAQRRERTELVAHGIRAPRLVMAEWRSLLSVRTLHGDAAARASLPRAEVAAEGLE